MWVCRRCVAGCQEVGAEERPRDIGFSRVLLDEVVVLAMFGVEGDAGGLKR